MSSSLDKGQTHTATLIREEVAEMKQTIGVVQRDVGATQKVAANTNTCVVGVERGVDELRQAQSEMVKVVQWMQLKAGRGECALQEQVQAQAGGGAQEFRGCGAGGAIGDRTGITSGAIGAGGCGGLPPRARCDEGALGDSRARRPRDCEGVGGRRATRMPPGPIALAWTTR